MSGSTVMAWLVAVWVTRSVLSGSTPLLSCWLRVSQRWRLRAFWRQRFSVSARQARRYVDRPRRRGRWRFPRPAWCSRSSCRPRWRCGCARTPTSSGSTISAVVTRALTEFLQRAAGDAGRGERAGGRDGVRLRPPRGHGIVGGLRAYLVPDERPARPSCGAGQEGRPPRDQPDCQRGDLRPGLLGPAEEGRDDRLADRGAARARGRRRA